MTRLSLPSRLDTLAAASLHETVQRHAEAGTAFDLFAGDVDQVGIACLQILASARHTASAHALDFVLAEPSDVLRDACALAGFDTLLQPLHQGLPA